MGHRDHMLHKVIKHHMVNGGRVRSQDWGEIKIANEVSTRVVSDNILSGDRV